MAIDSHKRAMLAARIALDMMRMQDAVEEAFQNARDGGIGLLDDETEGDLALGVKRIGDTWEVSVCDPQDMAPIETATAKTFWIALMQCIKALPDPDGSDDPASPKSSHLAVVGGTEHGS